MFNKLAYLSFLLKASTLSLLYRGINRLIIYFPLSRPFMSPINGKILVTLSKFVRSTHERRIHAAPRLLANNISYRFFSGFVTKLNDDNLSYIQWPVVNCQKRVYLIGDSHSEFYGRCSSRLLDKCGVSSYVVWIGPRTFFGGYFSALAKEWLNYCFSNIENFEVRGSIDQRYFAFSLGTIDIRTIFFQLTRFGPRMSEEALLSEFKNAVEYFFEEVILAFKAKWPDCQVGMFEVVYCVDESGPFIQSNKELKQLISIKPYSVLGSYVDRVKWCRSVNEIIMTTCKKYSVDFLPVNKHLLSNDGKEVLASSDSADGAHVTTEQIIDAVYSEILERMKNANR